MSRAVEAYSYGCLMAMLPEPVAMRVRGFAALIPKEDLYEDGPGDHGVEEQCHITVKYGLHTDDGWEVADKMAGQEAAGATLGGMSAFENDEYTVLKLDVNSACLHRLNGFVSDNFEVTDSFPVYHPHVTIAYLRKGVDWRKYACDIFAGTEVLFDSLLYSSAKDVETTVKLSKKSKAARIASKVATNWLMRNNVTDQYPDHKTEVQLKIQLAYDGMDEHGVQQDFIDKVMGLGARKVQIVAGGVDQQGLGVN